MKLTPACLVAAAALSSVALGSPDTTTDDQVARLMEMVEDLQAEVDHLRSESDDGWLTEQRAEEIRGLVQDVLADADTRASLLGNGMTAGWDKGFFLGSSDGNFKLKIGGQLQARYVRNLQNNSPTDDDRSGFEIRRAKIKLSGHIIDPSWFYSYNGAFAQGLTGFYFLEDAYIGKKFDNGWSIRAGQFKPPFMREELVSSSKQQTVDRSLVNERFNQDRSQGVEIDYRNDSFHFAAMYLDGIRFVNDFASAGRNGEWNRRDSEFAFAARGELLVSGNWKQFGDFAGWRGGESGVLIGAAAVYQKGEFGTADGPEEEDLRLTADVSMKFDGANLFAAFVYQDLDVADRSPLGFVVQGGYFFHDDLEGFVRYEYGDDDEAASEDLSVITVGVNKYFSKHNAKLTVDVGYGLEEVNGNWDSIGSGSRADSAGEDGQVVIRSQLQLAF